MAEHEAQRGRPEMPAGYGIHPGSEGMLPWSWVTERLEAARNYWIGTTRPDGRPHLAPVWGVWFEDAFSFGTDPTSRKGRNLQKNPAMVVHLESGDDVVILEGRAELVTDTALAARMGEAYYAKYQVNITGPDAPPSGLYTLRLSVAQAWREQDFPATATRWRFS